MKLSDKLKSLFPYLLAIIGGGLLPLGLAPFNYEIAAFASPAILLFCLSKASAKKSAVLGLCFGLGMFGFGTSWVYVSIHDYGATPVALAVGLTSIFTILLSLLPALMSYLLVKLLPKNNFQRCVLAFPVIWVLFEIFRGWILTGLPWLYIGYSQLGTHLSAFAPIGGIWLVSWATVFTASLAYSFFDYVYEHKTHTMLRNSIMVLLIALWGTAFYAHQTFIWTHPQGEPLNVSLIQGNIPQLLRWDPEEASNTMTKYQDLTMLDLGSELPPDLIVWPESAVPVPLPYSNNFFINMGTLLQPYQSALLAGVPVETQHPQTRAGAYYNALVSVGAGDGIYFKQQLVPFGEYVPFEKALRGLISAFNLPMSSFISAQEEPLPLLAKGLKLAPAICYEIAYPNLVRNAVKPGADNRAADLIVTVSNDTWFGRSIGPNQHLEIAQFRALETGRYVLRATNTGLTAIISPKGKIQSIAPQFETYILKGVIQAMQGQTPWLQYGLLPLLAGFVILLLLASIPFNRKS